LYNSVCNEMDSLLDKKESLPFVQGLEGYFRDPGFDQNTVRDSGKRKIF